MDDPKPTDTRGPLEVVYDTEMAPLISQLIELSKTHRIPLFVHAALDGELKCTTAVHTELDRRIHWMREVATDPRWGAALQIRFIRYDAPADGGAGDT